MLYLQAMNTVLYTDFIKLEMRVGKIVNVNIPEESEHLVEFNVSFGELGEKRIFAGVKNWYSAEDLMGKKTLFVFNLEPKHTPFGDSEGMLLATGDDQPRIIWVDDDLEEGSLLR